MKTYNFLAFDIGATSGRSIIGTLKNEKLVLNELTRFPNNIVKTQGKFYWDIYALFNALKDALKEVADKKIIIDAIGVDTWGVDFVYLGEDGSLLGLPRCYRDPYTNGAPEEYFKILSRREVYNLTGIQIMNFNSLFQLYAAKKENSSALKAATDILFMPDALSYLLTNKKVCEYTIASTAQLINPNTKNIENKLLEAIGINPSIIQPIIMPGEKIGNITEDIKKECGLNDIPVVSVAGHDTGSAVAAVPAQNENFAYLSSGTWSLMGVELKEPVITEESYNLNFTNEGGVDGTIRFLKNITGMWLLEQCRKEWEAKGQKYSYPEIVVLSHSVEGFRSLIEPDDASFANPESMTQAIVTYCEKSGQKAPKTHAEFIRCIFDSLVLKYRFVLECLQRIAPFNIERLHVIGGGSQNKLLNQMTANSIGLPVIAGPSEATAIGNIMLQAKAVGAVNSLKEMRAVINQSVTPEVFEPQDKPLWDEAYGRVLKITKLSE